MRVKISYGVDVSEIPQEIVNLLDYVYNKKITLDKQLDVVEDLAENEDLESLSSIIDKARKTLVDLDSRLADIESISRGYSDYIKEGEEDVHQGRPVVDTVTSNTAAAPPKQPRIISNN